jgi:hypothetical protein
MGRIARVPGTIPKASCKETPRTVRSKRKVMPPHTMGQQGINLVKVREDIETVIYPDGISQAELLPLLADCAGRHIPHHAGRAWPLWRRGAVLIDNRDKLSPLSQAASQSVRCEFLGAGGHVAGGVGVGFRITM